MIDKDLNGTPFNSREIEIFMELNVIFRGFQHLMNYINPGLTHRCL